MIDIEEIQVEAVEKAEVKQKKFSNKDEGIEKLLEYICSGNINFIIGAGASYPAIQTLGNLEVELTELSKQVNDKNIKIQIVDKINNFIKSAVKPNKKLLQFVDKGAELAKYKKKIDKSYLMSSAKKNKKIYSRREVQNIFYSLELYMKFLDSIYKLLLFRANDNYPKKINIFTTNYDLFFESACELKGLLYNEGGYGHINRTFSTKNFQKKVLRLSDYYTYEYEEPIINIVKLHGSINWNVGETDIFIKNYINIDNIENENINERGYIDDSENIPIILPTKQKFVRTLLEHIYYDISRFYANELEREQSVLFCFGFSFADEHIRSITKRALANPSLTLLIFPFSEQDEAKLMNYFKPYRNAKIIRVIEDDNNYKLIFLEDNDIEVSKRVNIDFKLFNDIFNTLYFKSKK